MLRSLSHEIVRRRLWPILAVAVLVAIAAPVLFMKSAPAGAPAASAAPAPATAGELPARAQRLLDATVATRSGARATGSARDPFVAPASRRDAAAKAAAASPAGDKAVKHPAGAAGASAAGAAPAPAPIVAQTPATTTPRTPTATAIARPTTVDVRFGKSAGGHLRRAIPRLQPFFIHGKLAAIFVKYSPSLNKAVFAVAPGLVITGPVKCRRVGDVCRYVDIPSGSYARLTMITADRILVKRRLDVAHIHLGTPGAATTAVAASDDGESACLLRLLRALAPGGAPVDRNACER